ncbi:hypothetical protein STCU_11778 [Strigomonas culicis]|uniref:Uncharacterized protein n=1 Tax=Strigomonas culicis TaxID=28005 RepID=S9UM46_9TRYP|nr:hypothetical protein STCU_11778 [Strigomonas culicis]|eukprot:EPY15771.1 hypothetical protein STCU_11778 [Strigomonas culicis]
MRGGGGRGSCAAGRCDRPRCCAIAPLHEIVLGSEELLAECFSTIAHTHCHTFYMHRTELRGVSFSVFLFCFSLSELLSNLYITIWKC